MLDRLHSMAVFVSAADKCGFAAAAKELDLSPTMVAKHVRSLEERVGERLLNRTTRQQSLTEVGRLFYERCRQVLADAEAADACAAEFRNAPRGVLKVHSPVSFGTERLAPALARYLRLNPSVDVELTLSDRPADLVEGGFEAAVRIGDLGEPRLVARPLRPYEMWLCASPAYLALRGTPQRAADLAAHDCLGFAYWRHRKVWRLRRQGTVEEVHVNGRLVANNGQALKAAAVAGVGIIMQPEVLVSADVAAGRLVRLLADHELPSRPMHLVYLAERHPGPKLRSFVDFVVDAFGVGPGAGPTAHEFS